jgi:hypothetical protein
VAPEQFKHLPFGPWLQREVSTFLSSISYSPLDFSLFRQLTHLANGPWLQLELNILLDLFIIYNLLFLLIGLTLE